MASVATYRLSLLVSIIMGMGLYLRSVRWHELKPSALFFVPVLSAVLVPICARLFFFIARINYLLPTQGWAGLFDFRPQGMAYIGSIIGLVLAGYLSAKFSGEKYNKLMDAMAPGALLALLLSRLSEYYVTSGQGKYIEKDILRFFPVAVENEWGEWYYAVFMLEAFFAFIIIVDAVKNRERSHGYLWQKALLFLFCSQILCESLRSETLRWGFVRVYQLFCAFGVSWFYIKWSRRAVKRGVPMSKLWPSLVLLVIVLVSVGGIEYGLDKWREVPHWLLYSLMTLGLSLLAMTGMRLLKRSKGMVL